jgi:hypothetical protein
MREKMIADRLKARGLFALVVDAADDDGVPVERVLSRSRMVEHVRPRHRVWAQLWERGLGWSELARLFDVDHTTVLAAVRAMQAEGQGQEYAPKARRRVRIALQREVRPSGPPEEATRSRVDSGPANGTLEVGS